MKKNWTACASLVSPRSATAKGGFTPAISWTITITLAIVILFMVWIGNAIAQMSTQPMS